MYWSKEIRQGNAKRDQGQYYGYHTVKSTLQPHFDLYANTPLTSNLPENYNRNITVLFEKVLAMCPCLAHMSISHTSQQETLLFRNQDLLRRQADLLPHFREWWAKAGSTHKYTRGGMYLHVDCCMMAYAWIKGTAINQKRSMAHEWRQIGNELGLWTELSTRRFEFTVGHRGLRGEL